MWFEYPTIKALIIRLMLSDNAFTTDRIKPQLLLGLQDIHRKYPGS